MWVSRYQTRMQYKYTYFSGVEADFQNAVFSWKNNRLIELSTVSRVCDITGTCTALRDYNDVFYCSVSSKNLLTWTNVSTICIVFTTSFTCIMWHMLSLTYRSICLSHSCIILRLLNQSSNGKLFFSCWNVTNIRG